VTWSWPAWAIGFSSGVIMVMAGVAIGLIVYFRTIGRKPTGQHEVPRDEA